MAELSGYLKRILSKRLSGVDLSNALNTVIDLAEDLEAKVIIALDQLNNREKDDMIRLLPHTTNDFRHKVEERITELYDLNKPKEVVPEITPLPDDELPF